MKQNPTPAAESFSLCGGMKPIKWASNDDEKNEEDS